MKTALISGSSYHSKLNLLDVAPRSPRRVASGDIPATLTVAGHASCPHPSPDPHKGTDSASRHLCLCKSTGNPPTHSSHPIYPTPWSVPHPTPEWQEPQPVPNLVTASSTSSYLGVPDSLLYSYPVKVYSTSPQQSREWRPLCHIEMRSQWSVSPWLSHGGRVSVVLDRRLIDPPRPAFPQQGGGTVFLEISLR